MGESRQDQPAGHGRAPPRVFWAALVSGVLLASLVAAAARYESGYPPGIPPPPFGRLIDQPAPAFSLQGLHGATVSSDDAPSGRSWLLFFAEASCPACDAAYPALARASERYPVIVVGAGDPSVLLIDPQGVVRQGAVGSQGLAQVLASPERPD